MMTTCRIPTLLMAQTLHLSRMLRKNPTKDSFVEDTGAESEENMILSSPRRISRTHRRRHRTGPLRPVKGQEVWDDEMHSTLPFARTHVPEGRPSTAAQPRTSEAAETSAAGRAGKYAMGVEGRENCRNVNLTAGGSVLGQSTTMQGDSRAAPALTGRSSGNVLEVQ